MAGSVIPVQELSGTIERVHNLSGTLRAPAARIVSGNYPDLTNKPQIEGHTLIGDKTFKELGMDAATVQEVEAILYLG